MRVLVSVLLATIHVELLLAVGPTVHPVEAATLQPLEDHSHPVMLVHAQLDTMTSIMSNNALYVIIVASHVLEPIQTVRLAMAPSISGHGYLHQKPVPA